MPPIPAPCPLVCAVSPCPTAGHGGSGRNCKAFQPLRWLGDNPGALPFTPHFPQGHGVLKGENPNASSQLWGWEGAECPGFGGAAGGGSQPNLVAWVLLCHPPSPAMGPWSVPCHAVPCQQEILTPPPQSLVAPRGPDCPGEAAGWAAVEQGGKNA